MKAILNLIIFSLLTLSSAFCSDDPYEDYRVTNHYDANHCEFYVDGAAIVEGGYSNMGVWAKAMRTEIKVSSDMKNVVRVGQWILFGNGTTLLKKSSPSYHGFMEEYYYDSSKDMWIIQIPFQGNFFIAPSHPYKNLDKDIEETAYFIDVLRDGEIQRYWLSSNGRNFKFQSIFSEPLYVESYGPTSYSWAHQSSDLFSQKRVCR